ncbi:uncharacterized protein LOC133312077 [Gastrolobium bilobum]|uniref:uncharacterized protein LOC133312077 n=1 Tax=Gastrolobium bilobum TaxID=150636 RepID=UPI002AAF35A9|nr:uncharacterized protein LOC133312077 [Gastrolobium bilobum]
MNDAFIAKRVWSFFNKADQLWVHVLKVKYESRIRRDGCFVDCNGDSALWRNMCRIWREMEGRLRWEVGNGKDILFWYDNWLNLDHTLQDLANNTISIPNGDLRVADVVKPDEEWDFESLSIWFPKNVIDIFRGTLPPLGDDGPNIKKWELDGDNLVSVKAIYKVLAGQELSVDLFCDRWTWMWRNDHVHGNVLPLVTVRESTICNLVRDIKDASFPGDGVVKINTDGVARGNPGLAAYGGLIRNSQGRWLGGFAYKLGLLCSSFKAELWGVLRGLELAWNEGNRNIIIESDSSSVITVLTRSGEAVRECHLIARFRTWINKSWSMTFMHTYREENICADWLENYIIDMEEHILYQIWRDLPPGSQHLLFGDLTLCAIRQGDSEIAESWFDQAAEYWKQAIALTPSNYIEAQNWLKITGRFE